MKTSSEKFGLLLARLFMGDAEALSVPGAARLTGLPGREARLLLEILADEGLLCRDRAGRGLAFKAATGSARYQRCRKAYCLAGP